MDQAPTGKIYSGRGIKLTAKVECLESLKKFRNSMKPDVKTRFGIKYGNILDLLDVYVHCEALVELGQYWDASLRCFTFPYFQMTPTIEEYGEILRMPFERNSKVYNYPGHSPTAMEIANLLGVHQKEIKIVCPGQLEGVSRTFVEGQLLKLANANNWTVFCRVLALAIYGIVIFPSSTGIIDFGAISVFHMVENYQINPIPAILADTYMSLSRCHAKKGKKGVQLRCCLALLDIWMLSHVYGLKRSPRRENDKYNNPLTAFESLEEIGKLNRNDWKDVFSQLKEDSMLWVVDWWLDEHIIVGCGDFHNVPLVGPRGCINYNPSLALRQLAYLQRVPSEKELHAIHFFHDNDDMKALSQKIKTAWSNVVYKGKAQLGKGLTGSTADYKIWLEKRIGGVTDYAPQDAPQDSLPGNDAQKINMELTKRLELREEELRELVEKDARNKEMISQLQNECATLEKKLGEKRRRDLEENATVNKPNKVLVL